MLLRSQMWGQNILHSLYSKSSQINLENNHQIVGNGGNNEDKYCMESVYLKFTTLTSSMTQWCDVVNVTCVSSASSMHLLLLLVTTWSIECLLHWPNICPQAVADVIQLSFCVLDQSKSFWGRLMCIINPHSSSCFGKSVGSMKDIQRFRFPRLIPLIQLQGMETFRIQFVLQSWSAVILARDWECASRTDRERERGGEQGVR